MFEETKTKKKERRKEDVLKCPPTKPTSPHLTTLSLMKPCSPICPSARPQKIQIFITGLPNFHRVMWAFWVSFFLSLRSEFHTEKKTQRTFFLTPSFIHTHPFSLFLFLSHVFSSTPPSSSSFFFLSICFFTFCSWFLCSSLI